MIGPMLRPHARGDANLIPTDRFSATCYQFAVGSFTQRRAKSQVPRGKVGDKFHGSRATNPVFRSCSLGGCHQSLIDRQRLALLGTLVPLYAAAELKPAHRRLERVVT